MAESENARIKLGKQLPNSQIPCTGDFVRIVCGICNKYREYRGQFLYGFENAVPPFKKQCLQHEVESLGLDKKSHKWTKLDEADANLDGFPRYTVHEVRELTLGVYQVKLGKNYTAEHTNQDGKYKIWIAKQLPGLLVSQLQSRHISNCRYKCRIKYSECAVTSWYSKCRSGARVVGACAHITSVIWYLAYSYARHANVSVQTNRNWMDFLEDAAQIPEAAEESDSGTEVTEERLNSQNVWF